MSTAGNPDASAISNIRRSCFAVKYSRGSLNADLALSRALLGAREAVTAAGLLDVDEVDRSPDLSPDRS
jgi:hypothetical protein